jgi:hypothetical protein
VTILTLLPGHLKVSVDENLREKSLIADQTCFEAGTLRVCLSAASAELRVA